MARARFLSPIIGAGSIEDPYDAKLLSVFNVENRDISQLYPPTDPPSMVLDVHADQSTIDAIEADEDYFKLWEIV